MTPEEKKAKRRAYYQANRDKARQYYEKNRHACIERVKAYRASHRQQVQDYAAEYYAKVTRPVRAGFTATTPIKCVTSERTADREDSGNYKEYSWSDGTAQRREGITINWNE